MKYIFGTAGKVLPIIIFALAEVVNCLLGNIIIYEATSGVTFDWHALLRNPLAWVFLIATILYYVVSESLKKQMRKKDDIVENAIAENSVRLLDAATEKAIAGDYESCNKILKALDAIRRRRGK